MTFIVLGVSRFRVSFFRSRRTKTCYSVHYPHIGQKRVIDKYNWEVLQSFGPVPCVFIEIQNDFCCFSGRVPGFVFSGIHWEPKYGKHAIVCITPTQGRKGVLINIIGRYCRVLAQFRMFLSRYNDFIVLGSRSWFCVFWLETTGNRNTETCYSVYYPTQSRKGF